MKIRPWLRRAAACSVLTMGIPFAAACGPKQIGGGAERVILQVENSGFYDVIVYALRSPNTTGTRLGNVPGGTSTTLRVRYSDLQAGQRLALRVRSIASNATWSSPALPIGVGTIARLRVIATATGSLNQSTLILESANDGR